MGVPQNEWHYALGEQREGPVSIETLRGLAARGTVGASTLIWHPSFEGWRSWHDVFGAERVRAPAVIDAAAGWSTTPGQPWRRYGARLVDVTVFSLLWGFFLGVLQGLLGVPMIPTGTWAPLFLNAEFVALASLSTAAVLAIAGTTPGKALLGMRVATQDDQPMSPVTAFKREIFIFFAGLGLGIPIVAFITQIVGYYRVQNHTITHWDEKLGLSLFYRPLSLGRKVLATVVLVIVVGLIAYYRAQERMGS